MLADSARAIDTVSVAFFWPIPEQLTGATVATYVVVLVLTYGAMPRSTKLFRRWLYPA